MKKISIFKKNKIKIKNKKFADLSMVIPTHKGSKKLPDLLKSIKESSLIPNQIIIVGTNRDDFEKLDKYIQFLNLEFYVSSHANQVFQRNEGFKKVNQSYIIQSDDDIMFEYNCIKLLMYEVKNNKNYLLSPIILDEFNELADKRSIDLYKKYFLLRMIYLFLNGFKKVKGGTILFSGRPVPDISNNDNREWLNSCICFTSKNLKDYIYFNSNGKSYYEDVYTSHNYFKKGYFLKKIFNAKIIHKRTRKFDFLQHLCSIKNQYQIVKKFKKSKLFFLFDILIFTIIFMIYK